MKLFGGDPRFVQVQTLLMINKYYSLMALTLLLFTLPLRATDSIFIILFIFFFVVEIARAFLMNSYRSGHIEIVLILIIISIIPMIVLDFLWIFFVKRQGFDFCVMIGYCIIHILETIVCIIGILRVSSYSTRFYRFVYPGTYVKGDEQIAQ